MVKKSIGSFLAALRKANGLTQEDVAQRLFVSNKTVSKWERDESCPDLALIPVLAEMYGVTCDEILRGERGEKEQGNDEKAHLKTEKQVQHILNHTVNQFKSVSCIAAALTVLGLVCHFAIAYTYFKPLVAFGLGLVFLLGSVVLEVTQLIRTNAALQDGAMLVEGSFPPAAMAALLRRIAFTVLMLNVWAVLLSWPMVSAQGLDYANSVVSFGTYLSQLPMLVLICLAVASLAAYFARHWLGFDINEKSLIAVLRYRTGMLQRMARIQGAFLLGLAAIWYIPCVIFAMMDGYSFVVAILPLVVVVIGLAVVVTAFIRMFHRSKERLERFLLLLLSMRNVLYSVIIISLFVHIGIYVSDTDPTPKLYFTENGVIPSVLFQIALITAAYLALKYWLIKKRKDGIKAPEASQE